MERTNRRAAGLGRRLAKGLKAGGWYWLVPVAGMIFCLGYLCGSFYDVIYSDYVRLVNSYLPGVWDPEKFFVPDVLTRIPLNYLMRIVNVVCFHYSIRFDQTLGVLGLGVSAVEMVYFCRKKEIGAGWFLLMMVVLFSLNKWEMLNNGSGWVHFWAFAGFFYHYLVWDRIRTGCEKAGDHKRMLWLPWVLVLGVAGPYCAVYVAVLFLGYGFCLAEIKRRKGVWEKRYFLYALSALVPFLAYLWSNAQVVEDWSGYQIAEGSIFAWLLEDPGFILRFFLRSLSSMVTGVVAAKSLFSSDGPYLLLGLCVAAAYLLALWLQLRRRIYERTLFPLILVVSGGMNHLLILWSRWIFLIEDYGMASRYALQFQVGILGILLTFALVWKEERGKGKAETVAEAFREDPWWKKGVRRLRQTACLGLAFMFLFGNGYTTWQELHMAPYRKESCKKRAQAALDFERKTDDELRAEFEYRPARPESGPLIRQALTILKENNLNVFHK